MRLVKIGPYEMGLVVNNKRLTRVIREGYHRISLNEGLIRMDKNTLIANGLVEANSLREYAARNPEELVLVEVAPQHLAIIREHGILKEVLMEGTYAYHKSATYLSYQLIHLAQSEPVSDLSEVESLSPRMSQYIRRYIVQEGHLGVLYLNGKLLRKLEAGQHLYYAGNSQQMELVQLDMRVKNAEMAGQEILTADKATIRVNYTYSYRIADMGKYLELSNPEQTLYMQLQLALRAALGAQTLDELLRNKEDLGAQVMEESREKVSAMGMELVQAGIRDIILPGELREIMNQVLLAEKKAQANLIMRREETAATRNLLNTARLMEENSMLLRLKEMEYIERIAEKVEHIQLNGGDLSTQLKNLLLKP